MEEEEFDPEPPRLREKLDAARQGKFRPYDPQTYDALTVSADETPRRFDLLQGVAGSGTVVAGAAR